MHSKTQIEHLLTELLDETKIEHEELDPDSEDATWQEWYANYMSQTVYSWIEGGYDTGYTDGRDSGDEAYSEGHADGQYELARRVAEKFHINVDSLIE